MSLSQYIYSSGHLHGSFPSAPEDLPAQNCEGVGPDDGEEIKFNSLLFSIFNLIQIDVWLAADPHFPLINGLKLSEAAKDVKSLVRLTDEWVNQTILYSDSQELQKARDILERIQKRQRYK